MKLILTLISLIFTSFALQTDASCVEFVKGYYNCQFGYHLTETFWETQLDNYKSFDAAMEFFRALFDKINNCYSVQCRCAQIYVDFDYNYYFLNDKNFNDLKRLHYPVKNHYRPRTIEQVNDDPEAKHFDLSTQTLNKFCLKYDWASYTSYHYYNQTRDCLHQFSHAESQQLLEECGGDENTLSESILKCFFDKFKGCDQGVKMYLATGELLQHQEVLNGDSLYDFVVRITNSGHRLSFSYFFSSLIILINFFMYRLF